MSMRFKVLLAACAAALVMSTAQAEPYVLRGNDTGGIIPYVPAPRVAFLDVAAIHCARYNKLARIKSIHRRYGDFVGFMCAFPRNYDPVRDAYALRRLY
jgi:hypothetical protein